MRQLKNYLDFWGLLTQRDFDGGDTAHKLGVFGTAIYFCKKHNVPIANITGWAEPPTNESNYNVMIEKCIVDGVGKRHPDPYKWWSDPKHFSRDQQTPNVIAAGFNNNKKLVYSLFKKHIERLGFYQNFELFGKDISGNVVPIKGDIATPEHMSYYFRAMNWVLTYPFLFASDLFMLLNSLILIYRSRQGDKEADESSSDNVTHILALLQAKERLPTPISFLARKIYKHFLKPFINSNVIGPQSMLDWYFREDAGGPPLNLLFRDWLDKEL